MKTVIVLVNIHCFDAREVCERIENTVVDDFDNEANLSQLYFEGDRRCHKGEDLYQIYAISDFMDLVNDDEFNQGDWFISYVQVPEPQSEMP